MGINIHVHIKGIKMRRDFDVGLEKNAPDSTQSCGNELPAQKSKDLEDRPFPQGVSSHPSPARENEFPMVKP